MAVPALAAQDDARSDRASAAQDDEDKAAKAEAKGKDNRNNKAQASQAGASNSPKSSSQGKSAAASESSSNASAKGQKASAAKSSNASSASKGSARGDSSSASAAKAAKADESSRAEKQEKAEAQGAGENSPAGNKGSMKVRPVGTEAHPPRNYAHLPCVVQVDFYGSPHSGATLTAVSHAPTAPTGQTLLTQTMTFSQSSPNPRGNELVGTTTLDFTSAVSGLTYHEQQGYHVKLTAEQDGPQGANVKHKVFWIDCPPPTAPVEDAEVGAAGETQNETTTGDVESAEREVVGQVQGFSGQERTEVKGVTVERGEAVAAVDGRVLGDSGAVAAVAGSNARALAATGVGLLTLLLVGLFGLGGGAGMLRRFRKR